tara:strand:+ start:949 stop:1242 length:294 start_codon:yes stop_codon:yes gene_type:complete
MDYIVTLHGFDHVRKFNCTEMGEDEEAPPPIPQRDRLVLFVVLFLIVLLQAGAIVSAASGLGHSDTYNADIAVSIFSPLMYWILRLFHKLGPFVKVK